MTLTAPDSRSPTQRSTRELIRRPNLLIGAFLISLTLPIFINLGPLRLSPYRLLLLISVVPLFLGWLSDPTSKKQLGDFLLIFHVLWAGLAMAVVMGPGEAIQPTGMLMIETFGAFFLARHLIRNAESYEFAVKCMFRITVVLLPFAIVETITAQNVALKILGMLGPVDDDVYKEPRWGFDRVQGPFSHPILFGVFCGSAIGMVAFLNAEIRARLWRMWLVFFTAFWCLSSGPVTGFIAQLAMVGYERLTRSIRKRWSYIGYVTVGGLLAVNFLSNRTPFEVFISYFAFDPHTAYNRIRIWKFGSASVAENPFFGIGPGVNANWARPEWMSSSVDMFWLLPSMQYGLVGGLALIGAFLYIVVRVCQAPISDPRVNACRTGLLISIFGIFIAGWTVHYWNATYVLVCFMFGSACWMFEAGGAGDSARPTEVKKKLQKRTIL